MTGLNTEELPAFVELLAQVDTDVVAADFLCVRNGTEQTLSEKHGHIQQGAIWMYRGSYSGRCDRCDKNACPYDSNQDSARV